MGTAGKSSDGKRYGWDASGQEVAMMKAKLENTPEAKTAQLGRRNNERAAQRGLLAAFTLGTSEIKTGAGEYGDETVADSLFPKTVNDAMSGDRTDARKAVDAKKKAEADAMNPGPAPDMADALLGRAGATSLQKVKRGRSSTFLSGGGGF